MPSRRTVLLLIGCLLTTSGCGKQRADPAVADRAEAAFRKLGGVVVRDEDAPGRPVVRVDLGQGVNRRCRTVTDADLRFLDGLETLEEVGIEYRNLFRELGGEQLSLVPALNDDSRHVEVLASIIRDHLGGWM